jgi:outer membrane receptor for ferric coprogen and ferric-rhodotorulic acid
VPQTELKEDGSILDPRIGSNIEVGMKNEFFNDRLSINLAYFWLKDDGRAYRVSPTAFTNGGRVENSGLDVEINGNPYKGLEFTLGYTCLKTKITRSSSGDEGMAWSPVEPEHSLKLWGIYRIDRFSVGIGIMTFSPKWASVLTPERKQDSYAVVNTFAGYRINHNFSLNLNFSNIFDKIYYSRVGGNGDYFGEPRNLNLSIRCNF